MMDDFNFEVPPGGEARPGGGNASMDCAQARMHFALLLYGELTFDEEENVDAHLDTCAQCRAALERQKSLHAAFDELAIEPPAALLRVCRADLSAAMRDPALMANVRVGPRAPQPGLWDRFVEFVTGGFVLRPVTALALLLVGFAGARLMPELGGNFLSGTIFSGSNPPALARVSDVEAQNDGSVRIVVDETRQRTITGNLDDQRIRTLLLEAVRDPNNPLRADNVSLLTQGAQQSPDIRAGLVYLVVHAQNDGVRLKAMEGLKPFVELPEVRGALSQALLTDANPGVRTQAIDLLFQRPSGGAGQGSVPRIDSATIGMLQLMMLREQNASVRERCEKLLEQFSASPEIY